jgi:hypothetical protein
MPAARITPAMAAGGIDSTGIGMVSSTLDWICFAFHLGILAYPMNQAVSAEDSGLKKIVWPTKNFRGNFVPGLTCFNPLSTMPVQLH